MNDSNLGIENPSRHSINKNSIRPPQYNGRQNVIGWWLIQNLFSACGDGGSFDKCNSNKCILKNSSFKKTDKILSSVTRRTYSYGNYENSYVKCNLCNIIYLIRCSNCFMQYVGETAQQLNITFATSRASMSGEMKLNCYK